MADSGFQTCVDAGGEVRKKSMGEGKHKLICYHQGKAYHSDVMDAKKVGDMMNKANKSIDDAKQRGQMDKRAEQVGSHNL